MGRGGGSEVWNYTYGHVSLTAKNKLRASQLRAPTSMLIIIIIIVIIIITPLPAGGCARRQPKERERERIDAPEGCGRSKRSLK